MAKYTGKAIFVYGRHGDQCALKAIYPCIRYKSDIPEIDWLFGTESSADTTPLCILHGSCGSIDERRLVWNIGGDLQWYSSGKRDDGAFHMVELRRKRAEAAVDIICVVPRQNLEVGRDLALATLLIDHARAQYLHHLLEARQPLFRVPHQVTFAA